MKLGKYWKRKSSQKGLKSSDFCIEKVSKKYLNINGKVSKDKWPSMFRYFAKYVKTIFFHSFVLCCFPFHSRIPFHSKFLSTAEFLFTATFFYCRFNQASILLFLSYVLHSFSARCAFVNSWRNTSAERVLNVRSTKRKSENHYLYTCELI